MKELIEKIRGLKHDWDWKDGQYSDRDDTIDEILAVIKESIPQPPDNPGRIIESDNMGTYLDYIENCILEMTVYTDIAGEDSQLLLACIEKIRKTSNVKTKY